MKEFNRKMTLPIVVAVFVALMVVAIGMQSRTKSTVRLSLPVHSCVCALSFGDIH